MSRESRAQLEAEIARHLDAGDRREAATAMLSGYGEEVFGYLVALTRDRALAEEVLSTVAEDLWRGLPGFRGESSARTWLYRLAWNALQRHRADAFRRRRTPLTRAQEQAAAHVRTQTAPYLRTDVKGEVARLREELDPAEQTLLILRVDRRLSWREVGEIMGTPDAPLAEDVLAKRFERVKAKLRRLVEQAGLRRD